MSLALEAARASLEIGEVPVGAVVVMSGQVIAAAHNTRESRHDPAGHAELLAIRDAAQHVGNWRLTDATLYVTKEPCVMCAGAMINARLGRLVYGCRDQKAGAVDSLYQILSDSRLNHQVPVTSGVLARECGDILIRFFASLRDRGADWTDPSRQSARPKTI